MKKTITLLLILFLSTLIPLGVLAQADEEASPPADERIQQKVEERIEKVLKATEEKKKHAVVGTLKAISDSTLTIETKRDDAQVEVDAEATIINSKREEIGLEDLEIGSKIIALGYLEDSVLTAKRLVIIGKFQTSASEVAFGVVTDISSEAKVLTIKHPKGEAIYMVEVTGNTKITKRVEGKIQTVKFGDIEENDHLVAIGKPGENEEKIITAKLIHVIPGKATGQESPSPTPEVSPTPKTEEVEEE